MTRRSENIVYEYVIALRVFRLSVCTTRRYGKQMIYTRCRPIRSRTTYGTARIVIVFVESVDFLRTSNRTDRVFSFRFVVLKQKSYTIRQLNINAS